MPDDRPTSTTIADILRGPLGARFLGDDYPRWRQGRGRKLSKSIAEAEHDADLLAKALRRDGGDDALALAETLDGCSSRHPCTSGGCPICRVGAQRVVVDATGGLQEELGGDALAVSVVDAAATVDLGDLRDDDIFADGRRRIQRALADCGVPAVGGLDVSANDHELGGFRPFWALHAWLIVPGWRMRHTEGDFRRLFPRDDAILRPVRMKHFDGQRAGRAYALKPDFDRRTSLEPRTLEDGSRSTFSTRAKPIWGQDRVELALALDRAGLDARLILRGFVLVERRNGVEIRRLLPPPTARRPNNGDRQAPRRQSQSANSP